MSISLGHRTTRRVASMIIAAILIGLCAASASSTALAQPQILSAPLHIIRAGSGHAGRRVPVRAAPPASLTALAAFQPTTLTVTYNGFSPEAQAAFAYAVSIWAQQISSPVPIQVNANWTALGPGVLGSAGPSYMMRDFLGAPVAGFWYPIALANKLSGADQAPTSPDISANFNSTFGSWYFGTDGITPFSQYDFVSVVLHELGHGIGVSGTASVDSLGSGSLGYSGYPSIYDRYTTDSAGTPLLNYANPSAALGAVLRANPLYFTGSNARTANGSANVRLYAPAAWAGGSSYAHLDETFNGTANALMTFSISNGESIHDPGDVVRGILQDLGWTTVNLVPTSTPTRTPTSTPTRTLTSTPTRTPTSTLTRTPTLTTTWFPTGMATSTPTRTSTSTPTRTVTTTPTAIPVISLKTWRVWFPLVVQR